MLDFCFALHDLVDTSIKSPTLPGFFFERPKIRIDCTSFAPELSFSQPYPRAPPYACSCRGTAFRALISWRPLPASFACGGNFRIQCAVPACIRTIKQDRFLDLALYQGQCWRFRLLTNSAIHNRTCGPSRIARSHEYWN